MDTDKLDLGGMMNRLMENPEFMSIVKSLRENTESPESVDAKEIEKLETYSSSKGTDAAPGANLTEEKLMDTVSAMAPLIKNIGGAHGDEVERRNRLLAALKPYLNRDRQEMIDRIMALSRITGLMDLMPGGGK